MIIKRIKKIAKIGILLTIREVWGTLCHTYLLSYQPFLTIKMIKSKKDKSQTFLVLLMAGMPFVVYSVARVITDFMFYGEILRSVGMVFLGVTAVEVLVFGYLGYWTIRVMREK